MGNRECNQNALRTARISRKQQSLDSEEYAFGSMPCCSHFVRQRSFLFHIVHFLLPQIAQQRLHTHTNYTFNLFITVHTTKLRTPHTSADVVHINGPTNPYTLERRVLLPCPLCTFVVAPDWSQERNCKWSGNIQDVARARGLACIVTVQSRPQCRHPRGFFCRTPFSMISRTSWKRRLWPVMRISPVREKGFRCHVRTTQNF